MPHGVASNRLCVLLVACRPRQWTKNLLVFAAPLFAFSRAWQVWGVALLAFGAFCAMASAVYLLNDVLDREADRLHPDKRFRAIASGRLGLPSALLCGAVLAIASLGLAAAISPALVVVLLLYAAIQTAYCLALKHIPLLDLFCIASGFLLRAVAGGLTARLVISPWFLLTVGLLALFLAIEKRKAELRHCRERGTVTRPVLLRYSLPLLLRLENLVATSTFMSYALWAAGPALKGASTSWMLLSVPFVLAGLFRYQLISDAEEAERRQQLQPDINSEKPEEVALRDRGLRWILIGWLLTVISVGLLYGAPLPEPLRPQPPGPGHQGAGCTQSPAAIKPPPSSTSPA